MSRVVELDQVRADVAIRRGYRNWRTQFGEEFSLETRTADLSGTTLLFLAKGSDEASFYLYDLIMNLLDLGSGFEIRELEPAERMAVMDRYLFILDLLRFEIMKRLGWLDSFQGEELSIVDLVKQYEQVAPGLRAAVPNLSPEHSGHAEFQRVNSLEKESFIRKLIPGALEEFGRRMGEES